MMFTALKTLGLFGPGPVEVFGTTPIDYAKTCLAPKMAKLGEHGDTRATMVGQSLLPHVGSGGSHLSRSGGLATHRESPGR